MLKKKIKDMTPEEYKEYKNEYTKKYNEKKKIEKEQKLQENIERKTKGKALVHVISENNKEVNTGKPFSDYKEEVVEIGFNPYNELPFIFRKKGIEIVCELFAKAQIIPDSKKNRVNLSTCVRIYQNDGREFMVIKPFWERDASEFICELTTSNFTHILGEITTDYCSKLDKMKTLEFIEECIKNAKDRDVEDIVYFLWSNMSDEYKKSKGLDLKTLEQMAENSKKNKRKK
jgi:hypothetical protein